jgi:hypothetical protein
VEDAEKEKFLYAKGWHKEKGSRLRWLWAHRAWPHGFYQINDAVRLQQKVDRKAQDAPGRTK